MRRVTLCAILLAVMGLVTVANAERQGRGPEQALLRLLSKFDLTDNSELSQAVREQSRVKSVGKPRIDIICPAPGDTFTVAEAAEGIPVILALTAWDFRPDLAVSAATEFANGNQVPNQGHLHVWIEDVDGNVVKFLGANAREWQLVKLEVEPGIYKVYTQLQNNDHTAQVQEGTPVRPAFDAVSIEVTGE